MQYYILFFATLICSAYSIFELAAVSHPLGRGLLERHNLYDSLELQCEPNTYPLETLTKYAPGRSDIFGTYVGRGEFYAVGDFSGKGSRVEFNYLFSVDCVLEDLYNESLSVYMSRFYTRNSANATNPPGPITVGEYYTYLHSGDGNTDSQWCIQAGQPIPGGDLFAAAQFTVAPYPNLHMSETDNHQNKSSGDVRIHEEFNYFGDANDPASPIRNAGRMQCIWMMYAESTDALPGELVMFNAIDLFRVEPFDPYTQEWPIPDK